MVCSSDVSASKVLLPFILEIVNKDRCVEPRKRDYILSEIE